MAIDRTQPNAGQIRALFQGVLRQRSYARAALVWFPTAGFYAGTLALALVAPVWLWPVLVPTLGLGAALLFIISHDAAHDAFTPHRILNQVLARLSFLPSWHPYTGWVHAHNHVHHGWTNFQPKDYVWAPLSHEEYLALSRASRAWVRFCRWWPGFGCYYAYEILWRKIWLPQPGIKPKQYWLWIADNTLLAVLILLQSAAIVALAAAWQVTTPVWLLILGLQALPAFLCNWLIAFITYLQHTHPAVPWFQEPAEWSFYMGQVRGTVHTHFPGGINGWIHNVMEHTAHHVDPRIPLYHLPTAQAELQSAHPPVNHHFTWRSFAYTQRVCLLYDFREHRWQDYAGAHASPRTVEFSTPIAC
jgi:omega-6 fatty acid desaturase (delta-12 desaturase)